MVTEEKEIITKEEKENKKRRLLIVIILLLIIILISSISIGYGEKVYRTIENKVIETLHLNKPTSPVISGGSKKWAKERIIKVEKDGYTKNGLAYYEYCINEKESTKDCIWSKTDTKNIKVSTTGISYITFRAVDKENNIGNISNTEVVYIDNNNPEIEDIKVKDITDVSIVVEVKAKDEHSGIEGYYYSIDGVNYIKGQKEYNYSDLEADKEYTIYVKVVDNVGNNTILSMVVSTKAKDEQKDDKDQNSSENDNKNDNQNPNDNKNDNKDDNNTTPSDPTKPTEPTEEEKPDVPVINLDEVPIEFTYSSSYKLPSYVDFGKDSGTYECIVQGKKYTNTSELKVGKHLIECTAISDKNVKVTVQKEVEVKLIKGEDGIFDGWMRLNLTYPENSTNWQWRLGKEEIRDGYDDDGWQDYTGPILLRVTDIENVYIRYDLLGQTVIIPPKGRVLVDIEPNKYTLNSDEKAKVKITYDSKATTKQYRIGGGEWKDYNGEFQVGSNVLIEARATRQEKVYTTSGEYSYTKLLTGTDSVFISEYVNTPNDGNGTTDSGNGQIKYEPVKLPDNTTITTPTADSKPSTYLKGPAITTSTAEITESLKVKVTPQEVAEKIYISLNYGNYQEYKEEVEITSNQIIMAYYIRKNDGKVSDVSYYYVKNIKSKNKPYVEITATPNSYISNKTKEVEITISGRDYNTLEYSLDGIIYKNYNNKFKVTESSTIYAKGTNQYGQTIEVLKVPTIIPPVIPEDIDISITTNPTEEEAKGLINSTIVCIDYDSKAEEKYYRLGYYGEWQKYNGPFRLEKNTTVYAYATGKNAKGDAIKNISFLTTGISSPIIKADTSKALQQVKVSIDYDKNAEVKTYQIGNGPSLEYTGPFYVYENTKITAYNKNIFAQEATSELVIDNIVASPNYLVIDQGKYYIIKLNYPDQAKSREYKWKANGQWKSYNDKGILLINPEYKDEIVADHEGIKVKDAEGKTIIFTDDYYIIDVALSELKENIFMRWDTVKPNAPEIVINPTEPAKEVEVIIIYDNYLTNKYYKILKEDGTDSGWLTYNGPVKIKDNNAVIYAKGETRSGLKSEVSSTKIVNIDKIAPKINVLGDFTTPKQQVAVTITAEDNMKLDFIKWAKGEHDEEYFKSNGKYVGNHGNFKADENGKYTIYAQDTVGNKTIKVIEITNIDKTAPNIIINVLTKEFGSKVEVNIDYGDSTIKQYKLGATGTYKTYTENVIINSHEVLDIINEDGSITIYAKGSNAIGNETEVSEKIYTLDLDAPKQPNIVAGAGYPLLTEYGVKLESKNYIIYDNRDDIDNYYSTDNGKNWLRYNGPFEATNGIILAKSVKRDSGLTITTRKIVDVPTDALGPEAYDGDTSTGYSWIYANKPQKIYVSEEMQGKKYNLTAKWNFHESTYNGYISYYKEDGTVISVVRITGPSNNKFDNKEMIIPEGTKYIGFEAGAYPTSTVYEITPRTDPVISNEKYYPILTEYGVTPGYNTVTIDYFQTTIKKLYRINGGEWLPYEDKEIRLEYRDKIETKGVDKYGTETPIVSYTCEIPTGILEPEAYDGDKTTKVTFSGERTRRKIYVSEEMQGKKYNLTAEWRKHSNYNGYISYYKEDGTLISKLEIGYNDKVFNSEAMTIPLGTKYITFASGANPTYIYEITPRTDPVISNEKYYPVLTEYGVTPGYNTVTIDYFQTTIKKLYRINGGEWLPYEDKEIRLEYRDKIETKGVDKYGTETPIVSYTCEIPTDALGPEAYDGDKTTKVTFSGERTRRKIYVSEEMQGKKYNLTAKWRKHSNYNGYISYYKENGTLISKLEIGYNDKVFNSEAMTIPLGTKYIAFVSGANPTYIYEITID